MNARIERKIINFNLRAILLLILIFYSCKQGHKPIGAKIPPSTHKTQPKIKKSFLATESSYDSRRDSLFLFELDLIESHKGDTVGFVSVSEIYKLPGNMNSPDDSVSTLVIPNLKGKKAKDTQYFTLASKYRKRLLAGSGISETDSLFVYDYAKDVLLTFSVKSLNATASLSPYEDATEAMHTARDYQIGFEINRKLLGELSGHYFDKTYIYIGAKSPFIRRKMHPIVWKKVNPKNIPVVSLDTGSTSELKKYKFDAAYSFEADSFHYYLQQYANTEPTATSTALRLLVINPANEVVFNTL